MIRDAESGRRPSERDGDAVRLDPDALRRTLHVLQEDQRAFDAAREIVARGARDLWIGLFDEEAQELSLLWGSDGRHRADLSYFRARGIAEYPYENIESAKLTRFGRSLLRYMDVDAAELPDAGDAFDAGVLGGESLPYSQEFTTGPDGTAIDFEIPERNRWRQYWIELEAADAFGTSVDPLVRVVRRDDGAPIGEDDDGGDGLNSRLQLSGIEAGRYSVIASTFGSAGPVRLRITNQPPPTGDPFSPSGAGGISLSAYSPPAGADELEDGELRTLADLSFPEPDWLELPSQYEGAVGAISLDGGVFEMWIREGDVPTRSAPTASGCVRATGAGSAHLAIRTSSGLSGSAIVALIDDRVPEGTQDYVCGHAVLESASRNGRPLNRLAIEDVTLNGSDYTSRVDLNERATVYVVEAAEEGRWSFEAEALRGGDPIVTLFDEAGAFIEHDDDGGGGFSSRIVVDLEENQTYRLVISNLAPSGGALLTMNTNPN